MKQYNHQAIRNLYPNAKIVKYSQETKAFKVYDENEDLINIDYAKVEIEDNKIISEFQAKKYQRDRLAEYPDLHECIHAILDDDLTALQAKRKLVKEKYPKP